MHVTFFYFVELAVSIMHAFLSRQGCQGCQGELELFVYFEPRRKKAKTCLARGASDFLQNQVPPVKSPLQQALSEPLGAAAAPGPRGDGRDAPTRQGGPKHRPPPVGGPQGLCVPSLPSEGDQRSLPATPEPRTPEPDFETKRDVSGVFELSLSQQMIGLGVVGRCCKSAVAVFEPAMVGLVAVG